MITRGRPIGMHLVLNQGLIKGTLRALKPKNLTSREVIVDIRKRTPTTVMATKEMKRKD